MAYGARLESVLGASPRGFESPILRSTSPGSVEIPGFFLCLQRFWARGIETDIYRLIRLGAVKKSPISSHHFELRLSCRNSLQGTFRALQSYLGTPVDGVVSEGSAMVMALQQRLNEGRF